MYRTMVRDSVTELSAGAVPGFLLGASAASTYHRPRETLAAERIIPQKQRGTTKKRTKTDKMT